jgi:fatty-acid desaturase
MAASAVYPNVYVIQSCSIYILCCVWRSIISGCAEYVSLHKCFSHPSFSYSPFLEPYP